MPYIFGVGLPSPIKAGEGLQIITGDPPILIIIGIPEPTRAEVEAIRDGKIRHSFGSNEHTAWMTLMCHDRAGQLQFMGEVFHAASKEPGQFTDERLAKLRNDLPPGIGIACNVILVDTSSQITVAVRIYSWSNVLSRAFVDAVEQTRNSTPKAADTATDVLLTYSTQQLAEMAPLKFDISGISTK